MVVTSPTGEKHIMVQLGETLKDIQMQMTRLALENNSWNITKAAAALGLKRSALAMRLKKFNIQRPEGFPNVQTPDRNP